MRFDRITFVIGPPPVVEPAGPYQSLRDHYEEFAAALSSYAAAQVSFFEGRLEDAPPEGILLLSGGAELSQWFEGSGPSPRQRELLARTVWLETPRAPALFETLEECKFACAIDTYRFFQWQAFRGDESGRGLFGLKSVAAKMGAKCWDEPFASAHYAAIDDLRQPDLPALLVAYLKAYMSADAPRSERDESGQPPL